MRARPHKTAKVLLRLRKSGQIETTRRRAGLNFVAEEKHGRLCVANVPLLARIEEAANVRFMAEPTKQSIEEPSIRNPGENARRAIFCPKQARPFVE